MKTLQRMKSDMATLDKRETADKTLSDSRNRNDQLTQERRFNADKNLNNSRLRNDELTADRREIKDGNQNMVLAVFLLIMLVFIIGIFFVFI